MDSFDTLWAELEPIGRYAGTGGYRRYVLSPEELACREWFVSTAQARGLDVETDRVMLCGSPAMLKDFRAIFVEKQFTEGNSGEPGHFLIERAFVDR